MNWSLFKELGSIIALLLEWLIIHLPQLSVSMAVSLFDLFDKGIP